MVSKNFLKISGVGLFFSIHNILLLPTLALEAELEGRIFYVRALQGGVALDSMNFESSYHGHFNGGACQRWEFFKRRDGAYVLKNFATAHEIPNYTLTKNRDCYYINAEWKLEINTDVYRPEFLEKRARELSQDGLKNFTSQLQEKDRILKETRAKAEEEHIKAEEACAQVEVLKIRISDLELNLAELRGRLSESQAYREVIEQVLAQKSTNRTPVRQRIVPGTENREPACEVLPSPRRTQNPGVR